MTITITNGVIREPSNLVVPGRAYRSVETGRVYICVTDNLGCFSMAPISEGILHRPSTTKYIEVDLEITVK